MKNFHLYDIMNFYVCVDDLFPKTTETRIGRPPIFNDAKVLTTFTCAEASLQNPPLYRGEIPRREKLERLMLINGDKLIRYGVKVRSYRVAELKKLDNFWWMTRLEDRRFLNASSTGLKEIRT